MAKIAVELKHALARRRRYGTAGQTMQRIVAGGDHWSVADIVCTCGPDDHPYEERHSHYTIAMVAAGSFQYHSSFGRGLMTPGSLMLGNEGHGFECAHQHGEGDRCLAFRYAPDYFARLAVDGGARRGAIALFGVPRLPPLRPLAPLVAQASAGVIAGAGVPWEELAARLAVTALRVSAGLTSDDRTLPLNAEARVTHAVRAIDDEPWDEWPLVRLARDAGLSPYHCLRTFERVTGITPHQYVMRARLREAATRLMSEQGKVIDLALECGFADVSNFNRAFRTEFGVSPRAFRRTAT